MTDSLFMSNRFLPILALAAGLAAPVSAQDVQPKVIDLPRSQIDCLLDNADKYLGIKRAVVIFTPGYCPAISRREVIEAANAAQNSGNNQTEQAALTRLALTKPRLRCMFKQLSALRTETAETSVASQDIDVTEDSPDNDAQANPPPATISLTLDCP